MSPARLTLLPPARHRIVVEVGQDKNATVWSDDRRFDAELAATIIDRTGPAWAWVEPVIPTEQLKEAA